MKDKSKRLTVVNTDKKKADENASHILQQKPVSALNAAGFNPALYLLKSVWDSVFEIKTDNSGQKYLFGKLPMVTQYGVTMYGDNDELNVSDIYEGLPIDNVTLYWDKGVLKAKGGEGGGGEADSIAWANVYGKPSWITDTKPKYSYSEIEGTPDLSVYVTGSALNKTLADYATLTYLTGELKKYVTIKDDQDIVGVKNFLNGIKISNMPIRKLQDDVIYIDANLVVRGGVTMYSYNEVDIPSILDSLPIASNTALGIASFDSTYFSVDANGMVSLTSAPSSGVPSLGELLNVDASIDATASVDRILYQPQGSSVWTWRELPKDGVVGDYLPLSGGTIDSNSTSPLALKSNVSECGIRIELGSNSRGWIGYNLTHGVTLYNYFSKTYGISLRDNGNVILCQGGGYVGIGVSSPDCRVDVAGDIATNNYLRIKAWPGYGNGSCSIWFDGNSNTAHISSNILVSGGITMYSDQRKKTILNHVELSLKQIADAPLIEHYYNSDQDKTTHVGSIAQYWAGLNDWFCKLDSEGFYTMEIQNCALASAISIARHLEKYETKTDKTIRKMKQRIKELEDKLEKLEGGNV